MVKKTIKNVRSWCDNGNDGHKQLTSGEMRKKKKKKKTSSKKEREREGEKTGEETMICIVVKRKHLC
jgi:hypothetical protein